MSEQKWTISIKEVRSRGPVNEGSIIGVSRSAVGPLTDEVEVVPAAERDEWRDTARREREGVKALRGELHAAQGTAKKAEEERDRANDEWQQMSQLFHDMEDKLSAKPGVGHTCFVCAVSGHMPPWPEADCPRCSEDMPPGLSDCTRSNALAAAQEEIRRLREAAQKTIADLEAGRAWRLGPRLSGRALDRHKYAARTLKSSGEGDTP